MYAKYTQQQTIKIAAKAMKISQDFKRKIEHVGECYLPFQ
jgi:hypothetical protein